MNVTKEQIEDAVMKYYCISKKELYSTSSKYPISGARSMFMYLLDHYRLYSSYAIAEMYKYSSERSVGMRVLEVKRAVLSKNGSRLAKDLTQIMIMLNNNN